MSESVTDNAVNRSRPNSPPSRAPADQGAGSREQGNEGAGIGEPGSLSPSTPTSSTSTRPPATVDGSIRPIEDTRPLRSVDAIRVDLEHPHTAALTALHSTTIGDGPIGRLLRDVGPLLAEVERLTEDAAMAWRETRRNIEENQRLSAQLDSTVVTLTDERDAAWARIAAVEAAEAEIRAEASEREPEWHSPGHRRRRAGARSPLGLQDDPRRASGFPYPNHRGAAVISTPGPAADLIDHAAQIIVAKMRESGTAPYHWAGALWEAGMLVSPGSPTPTGPEPEEPKWIGQGYDALDVAPPTGNHAPFERASTLQPMSEPTGRPTPEPVTDPVAWLPEHLRYISRTVTASYPKGMDAELVMRRRVGKVGVEWGELSEAIEGYTAENPRKGYYATADDVIKELIDCASASLCAVEFMTGDKGYALGMLAAQVAGNAQRLSESIPDTCDGPATEPTEETP